MVPARNRSSVAAKSIRAKRSTKIYVSAIPTSDMSMKRVPNFFQAKAKSGMLIMMLTTPTGAPVSRFMIVDMPVTPPAMMSFG